MPLLPVFLIVPSLGRQAHNPGMTNLDDTPDGTNVDDFSPPT
jgi:hypothetical protein